MQIDTNNNKPIYEQIYDQLLDYIGKGVLEANDKLYSVRELSTSLHINPNTVVKAYRMLEEQGFIYSIAGKGSFVSERKISQTKFFEEEINNMAQLLVTKCKYIDMTYEELCLILKKKWEED